MSERVVLDKAVVELIDKLEEASKYNYSDYIRNLDIYKVFEHVFDIAYQEGYSDGKSDNAILEVE